MTAEPLFAPSPTRLVVDVHVRPGAGSTLAADVHRGLGHRPRWLPPKHFYDDHGARLFDAICDLDEYYPTRSEMALLRRVARPLMELTRPADLVELGSGFPRKAEVLLDALARVTRTPRYVPVDISEGALRAGAAVLLGRIPGLHVHGVVGDYERHLRLTPPGGPRLVAFLGGTIGNLDPRGAARFLRALARQLRPGDHLLVGMDLVKDIATLERAYDDARGVTAAFNRNVLRVINRELGADFDPARFDHVAVYNRRAARIEMHLRARETHTVDIPGASLRITLDRGETIRTEISRKFTRATGAAMLRRAGFTLERWDEGPDPRDPSQRPAFALALARCPPSL